MSDKKNNIETENLKEENIQNQEITDSVEGNDEATLENIKEIKETTEPINELEKLKADLQESKDKYLRLYAEFENYRRRTAKEKIDNILNASEGVLKDLLPILDDFERAQKSMESSDDVNAIKEGIDLIFNKFENTVKNKGLKQMNAQGTNFDADLHECISQFDAGADKKGMVIDVVEKGYFLNDKVIRYAKVVVGS